MAVRPINASRFAEILEQWKKDCLQDNDQQSADVISDVILQLDDMPTLTPPNEWVSVDERLPGVSGNYICAVKDKNGSVWTIPAEWSLEMKMWIGAFGEIKNIVTHWMPLPVAPDRRPPEGEEDT